MSEDTPPAITPDPIPIEVRPTPAWAMLGVFLRQLGLIGGSLTTLFTMFSNRDIRGIFDYIAGSEFLTMLMIAAGAASLLWGMVREWTVWKKFRTLEAYVDDRVAIIESKLSSIRRHWFKG